MKTPPDLKKGGRGASFFGAVVGRYELRPDEAELLAEVARMLDLLDELRKAAKSGPLITDGRGNLVVHPAIVESRQVRETMRKSLHALGLPNEEGDDDEDDES